MEFRPIHIQVVREESELSASATMIYGTLELVASDPRVERDDFEAFVNALTSNQDVIFMDITTYSDARAYVFYTVENPARWVEDEEDLTLIA